MTCDSKHTYIFSWPKAISRQSHRLLTSVDVVRENLLLVQKKAEANLKRELIKAKRVAKWFGITSGKFSCAFLPKCYHYIDFVNFYILSHNKEVHNYKTQFTHKEIYGRVNKRQLRLSNTYVPNYPITTCSGHFFF